MNVPDVNPTRGDRANYESWWPVVRTATMKKIGWLPVQSNEDVDCAEAALRLGVFLSLSFFFWAKPLNLF